MLIHTITTWLAAVPPVGVAVLIALCYVYVAGGRWAWPMMLDAGLLALYVWKPYVGMLGFVLMLGSIRHIPALAREVVVVFKLDSFDGWTVRALLFVLPALVAYTNQKSRDLVRDLPGAFGATIMPPMVSPPPVSLPIKAESELPLLLGEGLKILNADPTAPHVGVIGATRLGKTTFVGVLLAYRESELVIATPKARQFDPWFDADVARPIVQGDDMSYAPIEQAVSRVHQEMLRRNAPGGSATPAITLVVDEWPQVAELPGLAKKIINLLRMGAGCGIRLILMATDVNVRGWKMDGVAGVLDNLVFAKVEDGRVWSIGRLDPNWRLVAPRRLDTAQVWGIAERVSLAGRGWAGARAVAPAGAGDSLLGGLLGAVGVPVPPAGTGGAFPLPPPGTVPGTGTGNGTPVAVLRALRSSGMTRERAREIGCVFRDTDWTEAGK